MQSELDTFNSEVTQLVSEQDNLISQITAVLKDKTVVTPNIQSLEVTENGVYDAPQGVDGFSPVVVDVIGKGGIPGFRFAGEFLTTGSVTLSSSIFGITNATISTFSQPYEEFGPVIGDILIDARTESGPPRWVGFVPPSATAGKVYFAISDTVNINSNEKFIVLRPIAE